MTLSHSEDVSKQLLGAWAFTAMTVVNLETGEETPAFGGKPHGYLIFRPDRMFAFIKIGGMLPPRRDEQPAESEARASIPPLMAYSGPWKIIDNSFITMVDMCLSAAWMGTEQKRFFKLDGDTLEVTTIPTQRPPNGAMMHGRLIWQRET